MLGVILMYGVNYLCRLSKDRHF